MRFDGLCGIFGPCGVTLATVEDEVQRGATRGIRPKPMNSATMQNGTQVVEGAGAGGADVPARRYAGQAHAVR